VKLSYDARYNIAYLHLKDKREEVESLKISDELIIDLAPDGTVYGIEFLDANEQLKQDFGKLLFINEATGERAELPLQGRPQEGRT
jgi:uncharacterized protein YuzE